MPPHDENSKLVMEMLQQIQKTLRESPALNGGWDVLMSNVETLDDRQKEMLNDLNTIKTTIYDPDKGIFARIGEIKNQSAVGHYDNDKSLAELLEWKKERKETDDDLKKQLASLSGLVKWKNSINRFMWVVLLPSLGTVFVKLAYGLLSRVQFK